MATILGGVKFQDFGPNAKPRMSVDRRVGAFSQGFGFGDWAKVYLAKVGSMTVFPVEACFFTNVFLLVIRCIAHCHQKCASAFFAKSASHTSFYRLLEYFECHCHCQLLIVQYEDLLGFEKVGLWVSKSLRGSQYEANV